jgi:uncharacterized protein (DUF885 family)
MRRVLGLVVAFALAACAGSERGAPPESRVLAIADAIVADVFEQQPQRAAQLRPPGVRYDRLPDDSLAGVAQRHARRDAWLAELRAIRTRFLGPTARLAHAAALARLEDERAARVCRFELWNVNQMGGWQVQLSQLAQAQPVGTPQARADALARFGALPAYAAVQEDNLREGLRAGLSAPRVVVQRVIEQLHVLATQPAEESTFASPALRDRDPAFRERWLALVRGAIQPALARHRDFLERDYLPRARSEIGVSAHPGGDACYRAALRVSTTLDVAPEEVQRRGRAALDAVETEMRALSVRSFGGAPPEALLARFRDDPAYRYSGPDDVLEVARKALARAEAALPGAFGLLPSKRAVLEPIPDFEARSAAPHYLVAALDGSRPAAYRVRLYQAEQQSRVIGESTAFHEVVPGHHLQVNVANELTALPAIVRFLGNSGFSEGWALYAERLADELGLYSSDADRFGMESNFAWRAVRMIVDPGMHALGMSRDEALALLLAHTALSPDQAASEIDRYIAWPGQAPSYLLGCEVIQGLRTRAEHRLGGRFSLRGFHDAVLGGGGVPLPVLRERARIWMEDEAR